jgi:hypothetical protein
MKASYTPEQLDMIIAVYQEVCAQRSIHPISLEGVEIAVRLLNSFTGTETKADLRRKILH